MSCKKTTSNVPLHGIFKNVPGQKQTKPQCSKWAGTSPRHTRVFPLSVWAPDKVWGNARGVSRTVAHYVTHSENRYDCWNVQRKFSDMYRSYLKTYFVFCRLEVKVCRFKNSTYAEVEENILVFSFHYVLDVTSLLCDNPSSESEMKPTVGRMRIW
jgi:hypothetical protein